MYGLHSWQASVYINIINAFSIIYMLLYFVCVPCLKFIFPKTFRYSMVKRLKLVSQISRNMYMNKIIFKQEILKTRKRFLVCPLNTS